MALGVGKLNYYTHTEYNAVCDVRPDMQFIEQQFIDAFGTKVKLLGNLDKGKIEITYFSQDDLNRIMELLS